MTRICRVESAAGLERYRADLTGEILAWVVCASPTSFAPVHPVLNHTEDGPMVIFGDDVFELDEEAVYLTKEQALTAYWAATDPPKEQP